MTISTTALRLLNDDNLPITVGYLTLINKDLSPSPSPTLSGIVADLATAGSTLIAADSLPFSVTAGVLNLQPATGLDLVGGGSNSLSLNQSINVTNLVLEEFHQTVQTQPLTVTNLSLLGASGFTLTNANNLISVLATGPTRDFVAQLEGIFRPLTTSFLLAQALGNLNVFSGTNLLLGTTTAASGISSTGTVTIRTSQGLTIAPSIQVVSLNEINGIAPIPLILVDGTTFTNLAGSAALQADGGGRWQVWSQNPANDNRGGQFYDFKQYDALYGVTAPAQSTGNAFFYTLAPVLTASIGPVTKQYNSTTSATGIGSVLALRRSGWRSVGLMNNPSTGTFNDKNVGANKPVTVTGLTLSPATNGDSSVYGYLFNSTLVADVGNITAAPLIAYTSAADKVYDGYTVASGTVGSLVGVFSGDHVSLQGPAAFNFTTKNAGTEIMVITSGLSLMGADAGNYTFTPQTTTANITAAQLFYEPVATTRLYGSNNPVFAGTVSGLVGGDTLASVASGSATFTSPATSASDVGSYAINGLGLTLTGGNYTLAQAEGNASALTITPAPLTYTSTSVNRTYGSANSVFTGIVTGLVLDQSLASVATGSATFASSATPTSNIGAYAINGSGLTLTNSNYTLEQAAGNAVALTITPAPLTYTSSAASRTYGSANPAFTGTITGLVLDQTLASVATGSATFTSPAGSASNVGTYAINGSGLTLNTGNYIFEQSGSNSSALTITPATLTYLANAGVTRTYGSSNPTFTGSVTGFVNGETIASATAGSLLFSSPATISSQPGHYAINGSGLTANFGNYIFTQASGNASALTITASATPGPTPTPGRPPAPQPSPFRSITALILPARLPSLTATYTGAALNGVNIPALLAGPHLPDHTIPQWSRRLHGHR